MGVIFRHRSSSSQPPRPNLVPTGSTVNPSLIFIYLQKRTVTNLITYLAPVKKTRVTENSLCSFHCINQLNKEKVLHVLFRPSCRFSSCQVRSCERSFERRVHRKEEVSVPDFRICKLQRVNSLTRLKYTVLYLLTFYLLL